MTEHKKILVNTEQFKNGDALFDPLKEAGFTVEVNETFRLPSEDELIEKLQGGVALPAFRSPWLSAPITKAWPNMPMPWR